MAAANDPEEETTSVIFTITRPDQIGILTESQMQLVPPDCIIAVEIPRGDETLRRQIQEKYPQLYVLPWDDDVDPPPPSLITVARRHLCTGFSVVYARVSSVISAFTRTSSLVFATTARAPLCVFAAVRSLLSATVPPRAPAIVADGLEDVGLRDVAALLAHNGEDGDSDDSLEVTHTERAGTSSEVAGAVERGGEQEHEVPAHDNIVAALELPPDTTMVASASH